MKSTWKVKKPFGPVFKSLVLVFVLIVVLITAPVLWLLKGLEAPSGSGEEKTFVINRGETTNEFAQRLLAENLIKNEAAFRIYLKISGLDKNVQAGSFQIPMNITGQDLALLLTEGRFDKWVTILEGLRKEQVAAILNEEFEINEAEFLNAAEEGYLFPDTYLIPLKPTIDQLLAIFQKNYDKNVTSEIINSAKRQGMTEDQMIILASIVEREVKEDSQRPTVAGILIKRWKSGGLLGADATTQYTLGFSEEEDSWWRKNLTAEDLEFDSRYNTRRYAGLPPGPISSPGSASIEAVANPASSSYLYYLHDESGNIHYAETLPEHEENISEHLR